MDKKRALQYISLEYVLAILIGMYYYSIYLDTMNIFIVLLICDIIMTLVIFIFSLFHNNSSIYDPYWSVIPVVLIVFLLITKVPMRWDVVVLLLATLVWAVRLTSNWIRDYSGMDYEDFRYIDFQKQFGKAYWLISLLGIHLFPTVIVFIGLYPLLDTLIYGVNTPVFLVLGSLIMISGAVISYFADEELRKHKRKNKKESVKTGLWKYSRHPNYFGELTFWFGAFVVSFSRDFDWLYPIGFISMLLLFNLYSIPKMEAKLIQGKVDYKDVIKQTSRLIPIQKRKRSSHD